MACQLAAGIDDGLGIRGVLIDLLAEVEEGRCRTMVLQDLEILLRIFARPVIEGEGDQLLSIVRCDVRLRFSGTGNSRHVAKKIAQVTGDEIEDIAVHLRAHEAGTYQSERPYVFVGPVYAGRLPRVMTKFIEDSTFAGTSKAYFVVTCAETPWVTIRYVQRLAKDKGFELLGFNSILMPQSYTTNGLSQPEELTRKILDAAEPKIAEVAGLIRNGKTLPAEKPGKSYMSTIMNRMMYATMMGTRKFRATDACIGCGTCAARCPLGNIQIVNGRPVWGKDCTQRNACVGACPKGAIEYGTKTVGKPRYYLAD